MRITANLIRVLMLCALMLSLALSSNVWAGVTGKISGRVLDESTGEPITSANVTLVGTDHGASTSLDGDYFIINVKPGNYSVSASFLGYTTVTQQDVMIYADLTATVEFLLKSTVIEGEEVIVKAQRQIIKPHVTASVKLTTGDEILDMPVANFVGALATMGGAVGAGTNIHIRGGRRNEVSYLIDGMEVKDPLNNLRMMVIGSPSVSEMVALTGGFDAEYGNAQSAVVNVVTKEGSKEYHGKVRYVFDDFSEKTDSKFEFRETTFENLDTTLSTAWQPPSSYQNYDFIEASLGGPEPLTHYLLPQLGLNIPGHITFFASSDITARNTNSNGLRINSSRWYRHEVAGPLGLDERREQTFLNSSLQLTYHINPKIKLKSAYRFNRNWYNIYVMRQSLHFPFDYNQADIDAALRGWTGNDDPSYTYVFGHDDDGDGRIDEEVLNGRDDDLDGRIDEDLQRYEYNAPDHTPLRKIDDDQFLVTLNHTLNRRTYYHVKLSRYKAEREFRAGDKDPDEYGEYEEPYTDLPDAEGRYNGRYDAGEPFTDTDGDGIWDQGNQGNFIPNYNGFIIGGDGPDDNIGQPVPFWAKEKSYTYGMKFQLTSQFHRNHQLRTGVDYNYFVIGKDSRPYPTIDNKGVGIYTDIYQVYPSDGAVYVQDKMEFRDITISLGTRLDFFMPGDQIRSVMAFDTSNAQWNPNFVPFDVPDKVKMNLSPRFGASFAITSQAYLHAHYGHFYQRPAWDDMFESVNQVQTGGTPRIGNPDLDPEKTVAFEVGVSWNPYGDYLIDITGFLKDVKNWINTRQGKYWYPERFGTELIGSNYAIFDNQDYAFARGVEFNFSKEYGGNYSGRLTYTLAWVNAKNSYNISTQAIRENYFPPPQALPAGWDQRHSVVGNIGFNFGADDPLFGIDWMPGGWSGNFLMNFATGLPYTPTDASHTRIEGQYMSKRTDWTSVADFNLTKYFKVKNLRPSIWFEVRNLFDRINVEQVDDNYGRVGTPQAFDDYTGKPGWVNDQSSPNNVQNPFAGPNPEAWDNPRFIRVGLGLDF